MSGNRMQYDEEFKKNAVKLSCASPKTVKQVADDLGIKENRLYTWRKKYTAQSDKTRYATLEEENKALRLQLEESRIEAGIQIRRENERITPAPNGRQFLHIALCNYRVGCSLHIRLICASHPPCTCTSQHV